MEKVVVIDKCQDCKYYNCKLRQLAGLIPMECPLMSYDQLPQGHWDAIRMIETYSKHILGIQN